MKLTEEQVETIVKKIVNNLKDKNLIIYKTDEKIVHNRMVEAFITNLRAEDKLDAEVKEMIESHSSEMDENQVDYRKMFNMIKSRLVRERDLII